MEGITCGIDWAEGHHDIAIINARGEVLERRRIDTGVSGFAELEELFAVHAADPSAVPS